METPTFVPTLPNKTDATGRQLLRISQFVLLASLMLIPLFALPQMASLTFFPKVYLVLFGGLLSMLLYILVILRNGSVSVGLHPVVASWWVVVLVGLLSAILSPNLRSALFGDILEVHTVGFLAVLGLVISLLPIVGGSKKFVSYLYGSFLVSAVILALLFLARLFFGATFLSLGLLQSLTDNLIGSFNDLGIFFGCIIMVSLVGLAQLDLPNKGLLLIGSILILSLGVLINVNFFFVWLLLALFSLMLLMYVLTKDRFGKPVGVDVNQSTSLAAIGLIGFVFAVSAVFLIGGNALGSALSQVSGVNYIEIRPSLSATVDIVRPVYAAHPLIGSGPNSFVEVWSLYKDQAINSTVFWNTPFTAAAGYVPTWFISSGILGVLAWLLFLGAFLYSGVKTLLLSKNNDSFWFFTGTISFVSALFIWILALVYVPGPAILLLGSVSTGVLIIANKKLIPGTGRTFNLLSNSKTGFVLITAVMICIIAILFAGYSAGKQVAGAYSFVTATKNVASDNPDAVSVISQRIAQAYALYPTDTYARALANYQLSYLNSLLGIENPTTAEQNKFQTAISAALEAGTEAVARKSTDARNWQVLGDIYSGLAALSIEGAKDRAFESYKEAEVRDPRNPVYVLQKALIEAQNGNSDEARRLVLLGLALKPNFTEALNLLSQLDIEAGDIPNAIATTRSLISIEVNNPGRYYQLGVLYGAIKNTDASIEALRMAISLNPSYANAHYFLAQQYLLKNDKENAIKELRLVSELSADNGVADDLIAKIESGEINADSLQSSNPITEASNVTTQNDVTTAQEAPDTDLLAPVNVTTKNNATKTTESGDGESEQVNPQI